MSGPLLLAGTIKKSIAGPKIFDSQIYDSYIWRRTKTHSIQEVNGYARLHCGWDTT